MAHGVYSRLFLNQHVPRAKSALKKLKNKEEKNPFVGLPAYLDSKLADDYATISAALAESEKGSPVQKF